MSEFEHLFKNLRAILFYVLAFHIFRTFKNWIIITLINLQELYILWKLALFPSRVIRGFPTLRSYILWDIVPPFFSPEDHPFIPVPFIELSLYFPLLWNPNYFLKSWMQSPILGLSSPCCWSAAHSSLRPPAPI